MTQINQLSRADAVMGSDLAVIYSAANSDARAATMTALATYIQSLLTGSGTQTQYSAPNATGFNVAIAPVTSGASVFLLLTPTAGFANGTVTLPLLASCVDGQEVLVTCTQAVTTLVVDGNGATVNGAPVALAANAFFRLRYDGVLQSWFRIA